jgi:hypothetical protein
MILELAIFYFVGYIGYYLGSRKCPKFKTGDRVELRRCCSESKGLQGYLKSKGRVEHIHWRDMSRTWTYYVIWDTDGDGYYYAEGLRRCSSTTLR